MTPDAPAEEQQRHRQHDGQRFEERALELPHRFGDHLRLVGILLDRHAQGQCGLDLVELRIEVLAEREGVAVAYHRHPDRERRGAVVAHAERRRVVVAGMHCGDVGQAQCVAADLDRHRADVADALERAVDSHEHAVDIAVDGPRGREHVLPRQRLHHGLRSCAQCGQALRGDLDVDALALGAEDVHLVGAGHGLQAALDVLGDFLEFGHRQLARLHCVEHAVHVGVFVVVERPSHAFGKVLADVADLLARQVPGLFEVLPRRAAIHPQRDAGIALAREAAHVVDAVELLQLALDAVDDLVLHLLRAGAGPGDDGGHRRRVEDGSSSLPSLVNENTPASKRAEDQEQHHGGDSPPIPTG